jgi:hypothetical protein
MPAHMSLTPVSNVHLVLILVGLVIDNVEEAELVNTLGGGNDAEPVTELLLLEELLGAVLVISTYSTQPFSNQHVRTGT